MLINTMINHSFAQMYLLIGSVPQVGNVTHGPSVMLTDCKQNQEHGTTTPR